MMKYEALAKTLIQHVGGKENVNSVVHCITRLRFKLKDETKVNTDALKNTDGVVTVMKSGGQYQVVIGNHVSDVYKAVVETGGFTERAPVEEDSNEEANTNMFNRFIDIVSGIFTPILGVLAATGMIKGFNALFLAVGLLEQESGTYQIIQAVGDGFFYFLPIFLGYTASKKFAGSPFIGMAIAAALVYPSLANVMEGEPLYTLFTGTMIESPVYITFLGIPVILMSYATSVIPIILATYFASKVEAWVRKIIPDVVKTFLVPFFTLLIVVPLTFIVIGPIATWLGQFLGQLTLWIYELSPLIAGIFLGGVWQVLVIFGLHWGIVPIGFNNIATMNADPILAMIFAASFAQIGAVLAVWVRTKKQKLKSLSIPAFISGIFGVTEPAIYGVTLPLKKPFIISCIAAAVGGGFIGLFGSQNYIVGGLGIFGIPNFVHPEDGITMSLWGAIISIVIAFILGFILTYLFGGVRKAEATANIDLDMSEEKELVKETPKIAVTKGVTESIASPLKGKIHALSSIHDAAFSSEALGKGVAIKPEEGKLYAPVSGTVSALFATHHAIGIVTEHGAEILIHIGMDTVQLEGSYFTAHVSQGDKISQGELLIEFDLEEIQRSGYDTITPIVITNYDQYQDIQVADQEKTVVGHPLLTLKN